MVLIHQLRRRRPASLPLPQPLISIKSVRSHVGSSHFEPHHGTPRASSVPANPSTGSWAWTLSAAPHQHWPMRPDPLAEDAAATGTAVLEPAGRPPALPAGGTPHSGQAPCGLGNSPVPAAAASEAGRAARLRATPAGAPCASSELRARPRQSESIPGPALPGGPAAASDSSGSLRSGRPPVVRMLRRPTWRPCSLRQPLSRAGSRLARRPGSST